MSYASRRDLLRGRGIFAAAGLGSWGRGVYRSHGLFGLGQTKTATTSSTTDRTASDWASALTAGASVVAPIIGAATGTPSSTPATVTEPEVDPSTAVAPAAPTPSWYWPVLIGTGVAVLGGIAYMSYNVKAPVRSNRRKSRLRRNRRRH